jgi:hypothetical protein
LGRQIIEARRGLAGFDQTAGLSHQLRPLLAGTGLITGSTTGPITRRFQPVRRCRSSTFSRLGWRAEELGRQ